MPRPSVSVFATPQPTPVPTELMIPDEIFTEPTPIPTPTPEVVLPKQTIWNVKDLYAIQDLTPLARYRSPGSDIWYSLNSGQDIDAEKQLQLGPGETVILQSQALEIWLKEESLLQISGGFNTRLVLSKGLLVVKGKLEPDSSYRFIAPSYTVVASGQLAFLMTPDMLAVLQGKVTMQKNNESKTMDAGYFLELNTGKLSPVSTSLLTRFSRDTALSDLIERYL